MPQRRIVAELLALKSRSKRESRHRFSRRRLGTALLGGVLIGIWSGSAIAWGAKAYYPTSVTPIMPDEAEAQRIAVQPPAVFRTLSHAHQTAMERGWKGIGPVFGAFSETVVE